MHKLVALGGAAILGLAVSACANRPHTDATMLSSAHAMPGPKAGFMNDRAMPSRSADCTKEALDKMPPEHRTMCEQALIDTSRPAARR